MVQSCVAFGCSNSYKDGVSMFKFPKDPKLCQKWEQQVKRTRAKWTGATPNSVLCANHFTEDCFEPSQAAYGIKKRVILKKDACPTIFKRPTSGASTTIPATKKSRTAFEKLNRARVR